MNVGLYFGSFNPIHIGHLIIANHIVENSDLDEIWFVVTPHNPLKKKATLLANNHRLAMVDIAIEPYPKFRSSNIEFGLPTPSYTINTLMRLVEKHPSYQFNLIMGEDNLKSFHKWKNYETILENHSLYVYPRVSNHQINSRFDGHQKIHYIEAPIVEISSTFIRKAIKEQKSIRPLLPLEVWEYIDQMNFYK